MKNIKRSLVILSVLCAFVVQTSQAQTKPKKPATPTGMPSNADLEKIMKAQGMSAEDIKMMKDVMKDPNVKKNAEKAQQKTKINSLKDLVPKTKKNPINITLKTDADVKTFVNELYAKLQKNGDAKQMAIANKIIASTKSTTAMMDASQTAMFQGDLQAALALSMKAVQQESTNSVAQNNVAALLTQLGYGENALPILFKINNTIVNNSTVINNIAYAYMDMGDLPKAYSYARRATKINPEHPQSRLCASAILEEVGEKEAAAEQMEIVNKHNNASISENVSSNLYKQIKMSWEDVKMKFTAFEYVKPGWRNTYYPEIVTLDVEKYKLHKGKEFADGDMRKAFWKKILEIRKPLEKLTNEKYKNSDDLEDVMAMAKGVGDMEIQAKSTVAFGTILNAFSDYQLNVLTPEFEELKEFENQISKNQPKPQSCAHNGSHSTTASKKACDRKICTDYTPVIDNYRRSMMQTLNSKVIRFMEKVEEEHRLYTNLIITYFIISQSTAGMSKDEITTECLKFIEDFGAELFRFQFPMHEIYYEMYNHTCDSQNTNSTPQQQPTMPLIPNFDCLVIFSFPSEFNEIKINNKGISAANNYGMNLEKILANGNMSSAISLSNRIAEAGLNADPYINVGNGQVQQVYGSPNSGSQYKPTESQLVNTPTATAPLPSPQKVFNKNLSAKERELVEFLESQLQRYEEEERKAQERATKNAEDLMKAFESKEASDAEDKRRAEKVAKELNDAFKSHELYEEANAAREMLNAASEKACSNASGYNMKDKMKNLKEQQKKKDDQYKKAHESWVAQQAVFDQINALRGDERDALIEKFKEIQKSFGRDDNEIEKDVAEIERQQEVQRENRRQNRMKEWPDKINTIVKAINKMPTAQAAKTMEYMAKAHHEIFGKGFNYDEACSRMGLQPIHREYFNSEGFQTSFNNGVTTANNNSLKAAGLFK
jgi:tetratricopeptide (TPR) repeat protein